MKTQYHLLFSGRVQGVWFRATARNLAQQNDVVGWVKNLADGRVEILAQADKKNLDNFLNSLKENYRHNITDIKKEEGEPSKKYQNFEIAF